mmetsp:Transcript_14155/g.17769  ORF Transcript_14155/g.17769 Transcript_14155/m.17769 type:complete len:1028 (+) Transcript_14155:104-3187(+)
MGIGVFEKDPATGDSPVPRTRSYTDSKDDLEVTGSGGWCGEAAQKYVSEPEERTSSRSHSQPEPTGGVHLSLLGISQTGLNRKDDASEKSANQDYSEETDSLESSRSEAAQYIPKPIDKGKRSFRTSMKKAFVKSEGKKNLLEVFGHGKTWNLHESNDEEGQKKENVMQQLLTAMKLRRTKYKNMSADDHHLSLWVRHSYCMPTFSTLPVITLLAVYLTSFYENMGVTLGYLSFFIALARSLDVISDPLMSYITDSCRTRFGRRRPFCVTGCWFYGFFLMCLLSPPNMEVQMMNGWFGAFYVLFFLANTFTTIPYDALGPELTDNYMDRNRLFFVSGLYDGFGALVAIMLPEGLAYWVSLSTLDCDDSSCYSTDGIGTDCLPSVNTGEYSEYDLGFADDQVIASSWYNATACATIDDLWSGLENYCDCIGVCSTRCATESSRTAFQMVGFFFGAWFCVTMVNLWFNVKERAQSQAEKDEKGGSSKAEGKEEKTTEGNQLDEDEDEDVAWSCRKGGLIDPSEYDTEMIQSPPMVPSLLNTFRNRPFAMLLPAWICDSIGFAILASMIVYFVRYVIQPEYQTLEENGIDCNEGRPVEGEDSDSWQCSSIGVLAAMVTCLLIAAVCGCPFWLFIAQKFGKRNAWLLWSFSMAITNIAFYFVGKGDIVLGIALGALNGFPFGAKFLADAILTDTIDYDEFLTGQRNEATYTMFKSFLPKICAIPAAAIPLAILEVLGHVAPVDGQVQPQPAIISTYCVIVSVIIPFCLSLASFCFKYRFPLVNKDMADQVSVGIGLHILNKAAVDPISKLPIKLEKKMRKQEREELDLMDYFPGTEWLSALLNTKENPEAKLLESGHSAQMDKPQLDDTTKSLRTNLKRTDHALTSSTVEKVMKTIWRTVFIQLCLACFLLVVSAIGVGSTFQWLDDSKTSVIPILLVIIFGVSLTFSLFSILRLLAAKKLKKKLETGDHKLTYKFVERVLARRQLIQDIGVAASNKSSLLRDIKWFFCRKKQGNNAQVDQQHTVAQTNKE